MLPGPEELGAEIAARYAGGIEVTDDLVAMMEKQAAKSVGLEFVETDRVTWDHRKLGGVY